MRSQKIFFAAGASFGTNYYRSPNCKKVTKGPVKRERKSRTFALTGWMRSIVQDESHSALNRVEPCLRNFTRVQGQELASNRRVDRCSVPAHGRGDQKKKAGKCTTSQAESKEGQLLGSGGSWKAVERTTLLVWTFTKLLKIPLCLALF